MASTNNATGVAQVSDFKALAKNETQMLYALLYYGPISVAFSATANIFNYALVPTRQVFLFVNDNIQFDFFFLNRGGVFMDPTCPSTPESVNHAVSIVGYGTTIYNGTPVKCWIVRNSWGVNWGYGGYFYMQRGVNMCNIAFNPAFPIAT